MSPSDWITLIAVLVALLAVGVEGVRVRRGQRHALAAQYIQRYWEIDDQLLLVDKGSDKHRHHRHRYLRLCEDEFAAVRVGSLDTEMWMEWHSWLATPTQRRLLAEDLDAVGERGVFEYVRGCLSGEDGHAWTECPAVPLKWPYRSLLPLQDRLRSITARVRT